MLVFFYHVLGGLILERPKNLRVVAELFKIPQLDSWDLTLLNYYIDVRLRHVFRT